MIEVGSYSCSLVERLPCRLRPSGSTVVTSAISVAGRPCSSLPGVRLDRPAGDHQATVPAAGAHTRTRKAACRPGARSENRGRQMRPSRAVVGVVGSAPLISFFRMYATSIDGYATAEPPVQRGLTDHPSVSDLLIRRMQTPGPAGRDLPGPSFPLPPQPIRGVSPGRQRRRGCRTGAGQRAQRAMPSIRRSSPPTPSDASGSPQLIARSRSNSPGCRASAFIMRRRSQGRFLTASSNPVTQ
jgi:hypothetical protein